VRSTSHRFAGTADKKQSIFEENLTGGAAVGQINGVVWGGAPEPLLMRAMPSEKLLRNQR